MGALTIGIASVLVKLGVDPKYLAPPDKAHLIKSADKTVDDILEDAEFEHETGNGHKQYRKKGGLEQADKDFDDLVEPGTVQHTKDGKGRYGRLPDGTNINVRNKSSSNRQRGVSEGDPTLEVQNKNGKWEKIRYTPN